ncbi:MAG: DegT/DnrJ/EryC1/StrS family aminotransferase, partial [Anaerolineales bacterium]|nr:DegT/DnrJ/EryC1/StrS family aminotransferase [Anaerolineales bacterium]
MDSSNRFIPISEPLLSGNELAYVNDCVRSGWVSSLGKYIPEFEQGFADFCGVRHGIAVSNGTAALHLALVALGIGPGDEVIIPTLTFIATANAVRYTGATPVFADSEPETWNLDPQDVARRITPHTRAIIPVHVYGHPANMAPILDLAKQHNLHVIEDAAEAHGARYQGKRVGSLGEINAFSFYGNKIITTGEGGLLTTDEDALAEKVRFLRDHAMSPEKRYWHTEVGFNYRMTNLQAALGVAQMERIEEFIARKRWIAESYNQGLREVAAIRLPPEAPWATSVYWMYSILLNKDFPLSRDEVMARLRQQNIDSRPFFYPIHVQPPYKADISLPVAENLSRRGINLPSAVTLSEEDIQR